VVERKIPEPGAGQVRIRVEACGICHTDAATITGTYPGLRLPRVPGHEVVGRVEALGSGVSRWKIGQRVGVGLIAGEDGTCEPCRRGDTGNCQNPVVSGVSTDGGYAEVMIAEARAIASVPDELTSADAAPLLCARITTYNALRNAGLRGGDLVAVQGVGGLGHLGIQFARHMGFLTVAIGRGRDKQKLAKDLGAHIYINAAVEDAAAALQRMGGARAILATATSGDAMGPLVSGFSARGKLIVVSVPQDPIQLNAFPFVFGGRSIYGSLTGSRGHSCLQRPREYPTDDRNSSVGTSRRWLRAHDARQSTLSYDAGYEGRSRSKYKASSVTAEIGAKYLRGRMRSVAARASFNDQQQSSPRGKEMSVASKPKRIGSAETPEIPAGFTQAAASDASVRNTTSDEKIRLHAYELYLERGERPGFELDDWLQAERELQGGAV
jgi:alcohol dehydrogenase, propanol-preferring